MGKFPRIGEKLRHGILHLGYFWEAVDLGFLGGNSVAFFLIPTL